MQLFFIETFSNQYSNTRELIMGIVTINGSHGVVQRDFPTCCCIGCTRWLANCNDANLLFWKKHLYPFAREFRFQVFRSNFASFRARKGLRRPLAQLAFVISQLCKYFFRLRWIQFQFQLQLQHTRIQKFKKTRIQWAAEITPHRWRWSLYNKWRRYIRCVLLMTSFIHCKCLSY